MAQEKAEKTDLWCPVCWLWHKYENSSLARHVRGVCREGLLSVRNCIDARIESLTPPEKEKEQAEPAKKVDVK